VLKDFLNLSEEMKALSYGSINLAPRVKTMQQTSSFEGQIQQLIINGKSYLEVIENGDLGGESINKTVTFVRADLPHRHPIKFNESPYGTWMSLPKIDAFHILLIQFHFKTTNDNGLILYNAGHNNDFIAVELVDGQINYAFSLGNKINRIISKSKHKLNDDRWHLVSIWRSTKTNHELTVDSLLYKYSATFNEQDSFNLAEDLMIGGLKSQQQYESLIKHKKIKSNKGYKGCLASIEINGRIPDLNDIINGNEGRINGNITEGCESSVCLHSTCQNGGVCMPKWQGTEVFCNCDSTTFTGKYCETSKSKLFKYLTFKG
jgi:neurexin